jgi:hypothetical protein
MPQIKAQSFARCSITVPLSFAGENGRETADFVVNYRSFSPAVLTEMTALGVDQDGNLPYTKSLPLLIVSIPDVVDEEGKPAGITEELLSTWSTANLKRLFDAIVSDENPPKPSPGAGQDG